MKIEKVIQKKCGKIFKKYGVKKAGVFGSYARGEQKKNSDIDLLVDAPDRIGLLGMVALKLELEAALKCKVDLVEYDCIKPIIKESVLSAQIPVI